MAYRKITIEESDDSDKKITKDEKAIDEYVPSRGESFMIGTTIVWDKIIKIIPYIIAMLLLVLLLFSLC